MDLSDRTRMILKNKFAPNLESNISSFTECNRKISSWQKLALLLEMTTNGKKHSDAKLCSENGKSLLCHKDNCFCPMSHLPRVGFRNNLMDDYNKNERLQKLRNQRLGQTSEHVCVVKPRVKLPNKRMEPKILDKRVIGNSNNVKPQVHNHFVHRANPDDEIWDSLNAEIQKFYSGEAYNSEECDAAKFEEEVKRGFYEYCKQNYLKEMDYHYKASISSRNRLIFWS